MHIDHYERSSRWLVACDCGFDVECTSSWAAAVSAALHVRHLPDRTVEHATAITTPPNALSGEERTLT